MAQILSVEDGFIYEPTDDIPKGQIVAMDAPFLRAYLVGLHILTLS